MCEGGEKEVVIPSGLEHFVADARRTGGCLQRIDGQLADEGEIFCSVILATAAGILIEQNVENTVQVVLDAPSMVGGLARGRAPTVDAADGGDSGEVVASPTVAPA